MSRLALTVCAGLIGAGAFASAVALAQDSAPARHVLHEDVSAPPTDEDSPLIGDDPRAGQNPSAFASGDKVLPEPASDAGKGDPVLGRGGFAADRQTETRPDYNTGADGTLKYVSVFNPDVLPFKRMTALDTVGDDYTLGIASQTTIELPVGGTTNPGRDRFWGDVMIELEPGRDVPLPSVAPDMRILSYEATPPIALTFSKDGADNFYVRSDEASAHGTHQLVFLADADAGYFAPALPARSYLVSEVRRQADSKGLLPTLPPAVLAEAKRSLKILRIDPDDDLGRAFDKLVGYFRAFEAKDLGASGDIYRDLFDNQAGVCRHRSFAFIITAVAAGIPTRYVTNEAHAFVEVWFPDRGWQRIDLGGAAMELEVTGADGKTIHRPRAEDPFAKPEQYEQNYTQLRGKISGLEPDQIADRQRPLGDNASGDYGPLVDGAGGGSGDGHGGGDEDLVGPGSDVRTRPPDPKKATPTIQLTMTDPVGYRGEAVRIEGRVDDKDGPVGNTRVDVFVSPSGRGGDDARLIGRGATGADGTFVIDAALPGDLDLVTYEVFVSTPESATHNPALTE